ncbi:MAG: response regulator [Oligoflexales bacterium]|nr:response regulator [Oligoflexales bacterium]
MSKKVLIVDDSKTIRQQVRFTLEKSGFTVVEADDGANGIKVLAENPDVNVIISDVNMPNMNGLEMVEAIKQNGQHPNLPIVMLTTEGNADLIARAKNAGAKGWLVKPFQPENLVAAVTKLAG